MEQAYLDEELSVDEVIHFEKNLSRKELRYFEKERLLQKSIQKKVKKSSGCPDALWGSLKEQIQQESKNKKRAHRKQQLWQIAAIILMMVSIALYNFLPTAAISVPFAQDVVSLEESTQYLGKTTEIQKMLKDNGFPIIIKDPSSVVDAYHSVEYIGVSFEEHEGEKIAKISISCCDTPAMLVIHKQKQKIRFDDLPEIHYHVTKSQGEYEMSIVSVHTPKDILALL